MPTRNFRSLAWRSARSFASLVALVTTVACARRAEPAGALPPAPTSPGVGRMVRIAGGTFPMGDGEAGTPARAVTVASFDLDATEVTVDAYAACVNAGGCSAEHLREASTGGADACNWGAAGKGNHPVNCVDWGQAEAYCRVVGKRLPGEEEWEYAARGGTEAHTYSWGNAAPGAQACWSGRSRSSGTCAVGSFSPGAFGLADMTGNVWEWTESRWLPGDTARVFRGGGWVNSKASDLRGANRFGADASHRFSFLGFRCAR
jgi:formylglycine-generating enzyme required for sulfatase activity